MRRILDALGRDADGEFASATDACTENTDGSAVQFDQAPGQRKTDPQSFRASLHGVPGMKRIEKVQQPRFFYAGAIVLDRTSISLLVTMRLTRISAFS